MEQHRTIDETRRTILAGIAALLVQAPSIAHGRPRTAMRRLGALIGARADQPQGRANAAALLKGLSALGWKEGRNLRIDWRWAGGDRSLYERYAAELVALYPDVILASNSAAVAALRRHTRTIPVVFATVGDPVGQGFVASLARPGGNVTGFSVYDPAMAAKWLQLLAQITPRVAHVAVLYNPTTSPVAGLYLDAVEKAAPSLALTVRAAPFRNEDAIDATLAALVRQGHGGLLVLPDASTTLHRAAIIADSAKYRVPAVYPFRLFATAGGLMSYGINMADAYRRAAGYIDRILKGAKPAELPVQNPTKFDFVINMKTARALGITIAPTLLAAVDDVIQ